MTQQMVYRIFFWGVLVLSASVFLAFATPVSHALSPQIKPPESECGDKVCAADETPQSCPLDCGVVVVPPPPVPSCGDGVCAADESFSSCETDCADTPSVCPINTDSFNPDNPDFLAVGMKEITRNLGAGGNGQGSPIYTAVATRLESAGVHWTIKQLPQEFLEPTEGNFNWANPDTLFPVWKNKGINILGLVHGGASWNIDAANAPFPYQDAWETYVRAVVRRYGPEGLDIVHEWVTWNEPNLSDKPLSAFLETHETAYAAIKAEDPDAQVFGPDIFFTTSNKTQMFAYLRDFIDEASYDGISIHLYLDTLEEYYDVAREVRRMLRNAGRSSAPLIVTEFNNPGDRCETDASAQQRQAVFLEQSYACLASAGVDRAFWFTSTDWHTAGGGCSDGINRVGILTNEVAPKPAYYTLRHLSESIDSTNGGGAGSGGGSAGGGGGGSTGGSGTSGGGSSESLIVTIMQQLIKLLTELITLLQQQGQ